MCTLALHDSTTHTYNRSCRTHTPRLTHIALMPNILYHLYTTHFISADIVQLLGNHHGKSMHSTIVLQEYIGAQHCSIDILHAITHEPQSATLEQVVGFEPTSSQALRTSMTYYYQTRTSTTTFTTAFNNSNQKSTARC